MRLGRYDCKSYKSSIRPTAIAEFHEGTNRIHRLDSGCQICDKFRKRENGKQSSMTAERIADLNSLGFEWVVHVKSKPTEKAKKKKIRPASSIAAKRRSKRKLAGSKTTGLSDEEEEPIIKIDPPCQSSTESTSSQHHHLNNNKHDPNKASMCHDRSHREQCHQQHHHGQKEVTPAVPRRIAEEGGFAFVEGLEETSRNMSEELERRKDQPTPQNQHQPQHPSPQREYIEKLEDGSYLI